MKEKKEFHFGWEFSKLVFTFGLSIVYTLYRAFVITKIWALLIMGFMGLPVLPLLVALGASLLIQLVTNNDYFTHKMNVAADTILDKDSKTVMNFLAYVWTPLVCTMSWFMAWIWTLVF